MHKSNKLISKGIDYSISIYDSIVNQDFQFKYKITKDYFIFSNSHFESSFFINSYDTTRLLYPQLFFEYNYFSYKLQKYINYNNFFKTYSIVTYFYIFIYINFKNLIYVTYKKKLNKYIKLSTNKNLLLFYYLSATSKYLGTKMANIKQEDYIFFSEIANNTLPKSLSKALKLKTKKKSKSYKKLLRIIAKKASFFKRSKLIKKDVIINSNSLNIYHNSRVMDACVYSSKIDRSFIFTKFLSKTVYAYPETGTNQTYKILRSLGKLINFPRLPIFLKNDLEAYKTEHLREGEITYEIRPAKPKNNKNTVLRYSNEVKGISYLKHH
jgi:hypothetical protein